MMATSLAGTASRAALFSRFFSPRPLYQTRIPAFHRPLFRSGQDEYSTSLQGFSWYCRCDFLVTHRRCDVRQALVPADHFWRCAPLRIADHRNTGGTREFSLRPWHPAALLEIDGRRLVSDAAFAGLLVLLRFRESLFHSQPGHWRHTLPAGPRFLSLCLRPEAAFGRCEPRHAPPSSRFRAAHVLVAGPIRLLRPALATSPPGFHQIQSCLLSPRLDSAPDDHHRAGGRLETQFGALAYFLR